MVDALQECWRVLRPGGRLIDLRPRGNLYPPLEVYGAGGPKLAGTLENFGGINKDASADAAVAAMVDAGAFEQLSLMSFELESYWTNIDDIVEFYTESWNTIKLPAATVTSTRRLSAEPGVYQLGIRYNMHLAVYVRRP